MPASLLEDHERHCCPYLEASHRYVQSAQAEGATRSARDVHLVIELVFATHSTTPRQRTRRARPAGSHGRTLAQPVASQARDLGARYRSAVDVVFSSDLARAVETVALAFDGTPPRVPRLAACASATTATCNGHPAAEVPRRRASPTSTSHTPAARATSTSSRASRRSCATSRPAGTARACSSSATPRRDTPSTTCSPAQTSRGVTRGDPGELASHRVELRASRRSHHEASRCRGCRRVRGLATPGPGEPIATGIDKGRGRARPSSANAW